MYGACRIVGVGPSLVVAGRTCILQARTVRDYAILEAQILDRRGNPFDSLREALQVGCDESVAKKVFGKLHDGWWDVSYADLVSWLQTWDGRIWALTLSCRLDYDGVRSWVCDESAKHDAELWWREMQRKIDAANGTDELGDLQYAMEMDEGGGEGINWRLVARILVEDPYNIPEEFVWNMSLARIRAMTCKREALKGPVTSTRAENDRFRAKGREVLDRAAENLKHNRHWGSL